MSSIAPTSSCGVRHCVAGNSIAHVEQVLVPVLRARDIVILDNLSSHKGEAARLIARAGARMPFLPPTPDLNPIEMAFAKLKKVLRQAEVRTVEALWGLIGGVLCKFTPAQCVAYIRHCGYYPNDRNQHLFDAPSIPAIR